MFEPQSPAYLFHGDVWPKRSLGLASLIVGDCQGVFEILYHLR